MRYAGAAVALLALALGCAGPGVRMEAQDAIEGIPLAVLDTLGEFESAASLAVAPDGRIYVADRGRDAIIVITDAERRAEGGPGTESGQFDDPSAVDAGTGLVIHVADAGNHRVQRFSREFRHLGNVAVDADRFRESGGTGDDRAGTLTGRSRAPSGRPIDLTTSSADELFVVDEAENVVLKWDEARRPERIIGDFGSGAGQLQDPVGIATDGDRHLYVADARRREVIVFDLLGSFIRAIRVPDGESLTGVATGAGGRFYVISRDRIYVYDESGLLLAMQTSADDAVIDVAEIVESLLVLTATSLYRAPLPRILE